MTDDRLTDREAEALRYAQQLAAVVAAHYGPPEGWAPLDDLIGVLGQIDNGLTGLVLIQPAPPAPEGQRLVPVEPSPDMETAGGWLDIPDVKILNDGSKMMVGMTTARAIWAAMLAAAPSPAQSSGKGVG